MKFFAAALIAALAYGQEATSADVPVDAPTDVPQEYYPEPTPMEEFAALWEQDGETGKWEFTGMPDLPQISFADVDDEQVMEWAAGLEAEQNSWNQEWVDAYMAYEQAVAAPWNNFVTEAERLVISGDLADAESQTEVISFVAENTFVDGVSLAEAFPEIEQIIGQIWAHHEKFAGEFSLDKIRSPHVMQEQCSYQCYDTEMGQVCDMVCEESESSKAWKEFVGKLGDAVISYGYNPETVDAWFQETGASWEELDRRQTEEAAAKAQADIRVATDYVKNILDNASTDLKAKHAENQAAMEEAVLAKMEELKAELERHHDETVQKIDDFVAETHEDVIEFTEDDFSMDINNSTMVLAAEGAEQSNSSSYTFAAFSAVALAAAGAYLYSKKSVKSVNAVVKESLLGEEQDEEFVQC